jgi:hypothetical protein
MSAIKRMRITFAFVFSVICSFNSSSQAGYPAFGKADMAELTMKACPFETDAHAMRLLDFQETEITTIGYDIRIHIERRIRIKIFDRNGFDAGNITIPYIRKYKKSKINDVSAYIYNLDSNGRVTTMKLGNDQIFKDKSKEGVSTISFTFPNIQPGSVIEYRYTHIEKNSLHIDPWYFQNKLPTALSVCKFIYPGGAMRFDYRFITTDEVIKEFNVKYSQSIRTFTQKNLRSFVPEPMMSSIKDNLQRMEFAFIPFRNGSWAAYNEALLAAPFFGEQMHAKIPGTESILDSVKKISLYGDKVHFIYQKVKSSLTWDGTMSFYADDLSEVWKSRSANSAELNLTILNLLKKSGIKAYPLLISTRENGKPDMEFTTLGQFNGVDILVSDSSASFILDGTQKHISYKTPPYNIINRNAFLIDSNISMWVYISDDRALMKTNIAIKASLNKDGEIKGNATILYYDHSKAIKLQKKNSDDDKKEFIDSELPNITFDSVAEEGADDELLPLSHSFGFTNKLTTTNSYYFLDPFFLSNFRQNPFINPSRRSDIDMGSGQSYCVDIHLKLHKDFFIDEPLKNLLLLSNDSSMLFKREVDLQDSILVVKNTFHIQKTSFPKEEYPLIRDYFKKIYGIISEPIIFKRK